MALHMTHSSGARTAMRSRILAVNYRLFKDTEAIAEWERFLTLSVATSSTTGSRSNGSSGSTSSSSTNSDSRSGSSSDTASSNKSAAAAVVTPSAAVSAHESSTD